MKEVNSLARELKAHLPWHQARIAFLLSLCAFYCEAVLATFTALLKPSKARLKQSPAIAKSSALLATSTAMNSLEG